MNRLKAEKLLNEIKQEAIEKLKNIGGTPYHILLAPNITNVMRFNKEYRIEINFLNIHQITVYVGEEKINNNEYVKLCIGKNLCTYFDIVKISLEKTNDAIFASQNEKAKKYEKGE